MKKSSISQKARCKTKYPIVMVHGHGWRDDKLFSYWGRIPKRLEKNGAKLYYGNQDSYAAIETNAEFVKDSIIQALKDSGSEKVNIIAHSKGGMESRYLINKLGMAPYVASLTTISTTHHGSKCVDIGFKFPHIFFKIPGWFIDRHWKMMGDKHPDFYQSTVEMSGKWCREFNKQTPNDPNIFYQSYAAVMKYQLSDPFFGFINTIVSFFDGPNDGLVSVESARWGKYQGLLHGKYIRGLSHADTVDMYRFSTPGLDVPEIYCGIVEGLVASGF